jgi:hypothetical protein
MYLASNECISVFFVVQQSVQPFTIGVCVRGKLEVWVRFHRGSDVTAKSIGSGSEPWFNLQAHARHVTLQPTPWPLRQGVIT